jgi:hypothetical protein
MAANDPLAPFAAGSAEPDPRGEEAWRAFQAQIPEGLNVDAATCFPDDGGPRTTRANKNRLGYLRSAAPVLRACLFPEELIRFICLGREYVWWEMFGAGRWAMLLNSNLIVLTDRRILLMRADGSGRPRRYLNHIPLEAIAQIKGFLGRGTIAMKSRSRHYNMGTADRAQLKKLVVDRNENAAGGEELLCPACFEANSSFVAHCPSCQVRFKSPKAAALRSLLLPGLGSWYVGEKVLGVLQMFRGVILWIIFIAMTAGAFSRARRAGDLAIIAAILGVGLIFAHAIDALLSRASAKKGLIALDGRLPADRGAP